MTITLPDEMRDDLEREAKAAGYPTVDVYVLMMYVRGKEEFETEMEWLAEPGVRDRLLALAQEGLDSGPGEEATPEWWAELRRSCEEGSTARGATP